MKRFNQTLDENMYKKIEEIAKVRGCSVQDVIRIIIIPEYFMTKET